MNDLKLLKPFFSLLLFCAPLVSMQTFAQDSMKEMDSQEMQAQGGDAPKDARDPHAYSGGTTLTEGPYSLGAENRLVLADEHSFYAVMGNRLEYNENTNAGVFDLQAWYGTTFDRVVIKTEGDISNSKLEESQTDILWGRAFSAYWDTQVGIRLDYSKEGKSRKWLAFGLQGLAPYWFELDMTAYVGDGGNTAFTMEVEYELLLSQKIIVQPRAEITLYGKDDIENDLGSGLSSSAAGFRIRYEFTRQFAPYAGVEWTKKYGTTANIARSNGHRSNETQFVAGVRFWF